MVQVTVDDGPQVRPRHNGYSTEGEFRDAVCAELEPFFHIKTEVSGRSLHNRRRFRLDAVMAPKREAWVDRIYPTLTWPGYHNGNGWNEDEWLSRLRIPFGVEFKLLKGGGGPAANSAGVEPYTGIGKVTKWAAQAVDYANGVFDLGRMGHRRLKVFACPGWPAWVPDESRWVFDRVLGQLGVGELRQSDWNGEWEISLSGSLVWRETEGPYNWPMEHKAGSR